jgi:hypothetical protein
VLCAAYSPDNCNLVHIAIRRKTLNHKWAGI